MILPPPRGWAFRCETAPSRASTGATTRQNPAITTATAFSRSGGPAALTETVATTIRVTTGREDDGIHGIWFNRGVAGSQAFVKRFERDVHRVRQARPARQRHRRSRSAASTRKNATSTPAPPGSPPRTPGSPTASSRS
jgi:hypothetical protein